MFGRAIGVAILALATASLSFPQTDGDKRQPSETGTTSHASNTQPQKASASSSSVTQSQKTNASTETFKITSPVSILHTEPSADLSDKFYTSGEIEYSKIIALLQSLGIVAADDHTDTQDIHSQRVTIIHILRWDNTEHSGIKFQKWYVYDPSAPNYYTYLKTRQSLFEGTNIAGRTNYRVIYIHLNSAFGPDTTVVDPTTHAVTGTHDESIVSACIAIPPSTTPSQTSDCLIHPVSYTISITKEHTQFVQDLESVLGLVEPSLAGLGGGAPPPVTGYWSMSEFTSQYSSSSLTITPAMNSDQNGGTHQSSQKTQSTQTGQASTDSQNKASLQLSPNTYSNQKPSYVGLSFAVPVTSYKDITYQSSSGTLTPKSITQQNVYVNFDVYYPAAQPGLALVRWIPHPFVGLPIKGKVLEHPMAGAAFGLPWFEPFGAVVFDRQNGTVNSVSQKTTYKGIVGFKLSVSTVVAALKK